MFVSFVSVQGCLLITPPTQSGCCLGCFIALPLPPPVNCFTFNGITFRTATTFPKPLCQITIPQCTNILYISSIQHENEL